MSVLPNKNFFLNLTFLSSILILSACDFGPPQKPSVLVIAVESINFEKLNCDQSQLFQKGFQVLCDEAIRFTHHFTPSPMSQPALASMMTGQYPFEHGVWHNGKQYLSSKIETVSEVAVKNGYRTSFFSGGPPIFKKSGLGQGFEKFDDFLVVTFNSLYRPVLNNFQRFVKWATTEIDGESFFSVIYVPDLQFPTQTTFTDSGTMRPLEYNSQVLELGESLHWLVETLKEKRIWHKTHVIFVGLNGTSTQQRLNEIDPNNLYFEIVRTPLFIKPVQKLRDQGINWKIDRNVSMVDLGMTLYDLVGEPPMDRIKSELEVTSLSSVLEKPEVNWNPSRYILIESAYSQWRKLLGSRFSLRSGNYVLIYDKQAKLYNSLIDRDELSPIPEKDVLWSTILKPMEDYMNQKGFNKWLGPDLYFINKVRLAGLIWGPQRKDESLLVQELESLIKQSPRDKELLGWKAELALQRKDWKLLLEAGQQAKNKYWIFLAKKQLGQPVTLANRGCASVFVGRKIESLSPRNCSDELLIELMLYKTAKDDPSREQKFERFLKDYYNYRLVRTAYIENYKVALQWDVDMSYSLGPSLTDIYLQLDENKLLKERIEKRLSKI